jgi:hypothetical protein
LRKDRDEGERFVVEGGARGGGQHRRRTDLDERPDAFGGERAQAVVEPDGRADLLHPVLRRSQVGPGGDRGDDRDFGLRVSELLRHDRELVEHRFHQRRVERVGNAQLLRPLEVRDDGGDLVFGARDHQGARAVDRGDAHPGGQQRGHVGLGGRDGDHRPSGRQLLHEPGAGRDERAGVVEREDPGDVGRGQLTDRVAQQVVGPDTPGLDQPVERDLEREQRGLGETGLCQGFGVVEDRAVEVEPGADGVEGFGEHGVLRGEGLAHAGALGALAGEEEGRPAGAPAVTDHVRRVLARGERGQPGAQLGGVGSDDDGAVVQRRAGRGQRVADVGQVAGVVHELPSLRGDGVRGVRRNRPRDDRDLRCRGLFGDGFGLLDDHVGVGAADAERRHRATAGPLGLGPLAGLGEQLDRAGGPVDVRRRLVDVQGLREHAVPDGLDDLDHAADAGGRLGVADVGLERAEPQRPVRGTVLAVGGQQGLRLDRVAELRAGAVAFDEVDVRCGQSGGGEGLADHALLRRSIGDGQATGRAVGVDRAAADDGENVVAQALGVGKPLDDEHADTFAPARAVGAGGEGLAAAVVGQAALLGEVDERLGGRHHRDAADEGQRAVAAAQRLRGPVQGDQGGRAGGVDRDRGAFQPERVGDPAGDDAAGGRVAEVVVVHHAGEDAGAAAAQGFRDDARALQRGPRRLEQQPLLGVHGERFARRDPEELGVEFRGVTQEAALAGVRGAGPLPRRVVEAVEGPAAVGRERADGVGPGADQLPEVVGARDSAGKAAVHADDRDRLAVAPPDLVQSTLGLAQVGRRALEVVEQFPLVLGAHAITPWKMAGRTVFT